MQNYTHTNDKIIKLAHNKKLQAETLLNQLLQMVLKKKKEKREPLAVN